MLTELPNELKLMITDQLDDLSYFCLRSALCQNHGKLPRKLYSELLKQNYTHLEWFLQHNLVNTELFAHYVVQNNNIEVLRWLHAQNYLKRSALLTHEAAAQGHLKMLKWLRQENFPLNIEVIKAAIRKGQHKVFKWLLEVVKISKHTLYTYAVNSGQFAMAQQLLQR